VTLRHAGPGEVALEPRAQAGNISPMDPHRAPPVLDMTPDGEFRDPLPPPGKPLDRLLARVGGLAVLVALAAGGVVIAGLAVLFAAIALPVLLLAGAVGAGSIWWRMRRLRRNMGAGGPGGPGAVRFVVIRR